MATSQTSSGRRAPAPKNRASRTTPVTPNSAAVTKLHPAFQGPDGIERALTPALVALALDLSEETRHRASEEQTALPIGLTEQEPFRSEAEHLLSSLADVDADATAGQEDDPAGARQLQCALFAAHFLYVGFFIGASFVRNGGAVGGPASQIAAAKQGGGR